MAENPQEAGKPQVRDEIRTYESDQIRVIWNPSRCIHTAICLRRLPSVFDVNARPWVALSGAAAGAVADTVSACPTGALRWEAIGTIADEEPDEPTNIEVRPNGPLFVRGRTRIEGPRGHTIAEEYRVALCRCGASTNKPFCDNSHRLIRFRDQDPS